MKQLFSALFLLLTGTAGFSQDTEFGNAANALIYADAAVHQLKYIVDSLNLKFKTCGTTPVYRAKPQTRANYISLEKYRVKEAKKDIEAGIAFDSFAKKYIKADIEKELLVVRHPYKNYMEKDVIGFFSFEINNRYDHKLEFDENLETYYQPLKGKWVYKYYKKTEYSAESIDAFYFIDEFTERTIPEVYAKKIQYSDCLVDTSVQVFYKNAKESGVRFETKNPAGVEKFMDYIHKATDKPEYGRLSDDAYWKKYQLWDSLRIHRADSLRSVDAGFDRMLAAAVSEAEKDGGSTNEFEEYTERYFSKKKALELKRNRRVIGGCSMDNSPRVHALNIARLSAETACWEIFLRSHLDIMNDRFERMSDGSYAWGQRKTYIKELEVLNINVTDLLLGISMRIGNPAENHYYGSVGRLGRALSETKNAAQAENEMLAMITDTGLDDLNRLLTYYLFLNYNYNLDDKKKQAENKKKLAAAADTLPRYLLDKIKAKKQK